MKKLFTLILGLAVTSFAYSQSERMVLVEEGTNASCAPCASQNPGFHALLDANPDNVIAISYQVWWPGYDPMYEDNEADVDVRIPYYSINGAPTAVIDGVTPTGATPGFDAAWYDGAPGGYSQTVIDDAAAIPASFDIDIDYEMDPDGITIDATATCTQDVSGDLRFHVVVIEKHINWDSAPGTNGETSFYRVMKKMLPNAAGLEMAGSYTVGETAVSSQSWDLSTVYDMNEVAVVAFVQDDNTKEILQAAMADDGEFGAVYTTDAAPISNNALDISCESEVNPTIEIRNNGSETLTSVDINYEINGTTGTYAWTGSLEFFETEMVELGNITFTSDDDNTMVVSLSNPNGNSDENPDNDEYEFTVPVAPETTLGITVLVHTDYYAVETTWEIRNSSGDLVASGGYEAGEEDQWGGGGPDANMTHVHNVVLQDPFDCHSFTIFDEFGDGMSYGATAAEELFGYQVLDGFGNEVLNFTESAGNGGLNFGSENENAMTTSDILSVNESSIDATLNIYPNPASETLNIAFELTESEHVTVDIVNLLGQVIWSKDFGTMSSGIALENINVSDFNSGLYLININTEDSQIVRKITITE